MELNDKQKKALKAIVFESQFLQGDYQIKGKLGRNIGHKTLDSLIEMGLIESGSSKRWYGAIGYRPTELGKETELSLY